LDQQRLGRAVVRTYLNIAASPASTAAVVLDATRKAGAATDVALRIRRLGRLSGAALQTYAEAAGVSSRDLTLWCIPLLETTGLIDIARDAEGLASEVEERVGVGSPVLEQAAAIWLAAKPDARERCAIHSSDLLAYAPMGETAHRNVLEREGFPARLHKQVFAALETLGVLRRQRSQQLNEEVLYSPYVWGTEAVNVADFISRLPGPEREALVGIFREAMDRPGASVEQLSADRRLLAGAQRVGLLDVTRVVSSSGQEHTFAFAPVLEQQLQLRGTDVAHERKLFVSHILNGYRFGYPGTGKIRDPLVLVEALINRGRVGPATAIRGDYPLLEARGIVRVVPDKGTTAYLELVKDDVARDSLDLLKLALDEPTRGTLTANSIRTLWVPGGFLTPEQLRHRVGEPPASAQTEVLAATVEELRRHIQPVLRREEPF
jgi:hypothetical protein